MSARRLVAAWALLSSACTAAPPAPGPEATPPDDTERVIRLAVARQEAGALAEATLLFDAVTQQSPPSPFQDRALAGLGRVLVSPDHGGRDYRRAHAVFDRLVREHPDSAYAAEARAWRDLLGAYLAAGLELERRTQELLSRSEELLGRTLELDRLRHVERELVRRTQELEQRTEELERLKHLQLELERRSRELAERTQELERLKRVDLELERRRTP
jgi:outer membrane protein assembly factor BamD (BamD/ComL family)